MLVGQRETCHVEKERENTDLGFSYCIFCSNVFVHWFCFNVVCLVHCPFFRAHSKMGVRNLSSLFTSSWLVFNSVSLPRNVFELTPSKQVVTLLPPGVGGRTIYVFGGSTPALKIKDI